MKNQKIKINKVFIAIFILSIILTAGIFENIFIERTFDDLNRRFEIIQMYLENDDREKALSATNDTIKWWDNKRHFIEMFTFSSDLRLLSVTLGETKGSIESEDMSNAMSKIESLFNISNNLKEMLNFNLSDII